MRLNPRMSMSALSERLCYFLTLGLRAGVWIIVAAHYQAHAQTEEVPVRVAPQVQEVLYVQEATPLLGDPTRNSKIKARMEKGLQLEVLGTEGEEWVFVRASGYLEGWVERRYLGYDRRHDASPELAEALAAEDLRSFHHAFLFRSYGLAQLEGFVGLGNLRNKANHPLKSTRGFSYGAGGGLHVADLFGRGALSAESRLRFSQERWSVRGSKVDEHISPLSLGLSLGLRWIEPYDRELAMGYLAGFELYTMLDEGELLLERPSSFRSYLGFTMSWAAPEPLKAVILEIPIFFSTDMVNFGAGLALAF
jgi:hypothetical protein